MGTISTPGFPESVQAALRADEALAERIARALVDAHFPATIQEEVLEAVGIEARYEHSHRKKRDRSFSARVLSAYGHACAVCGFAVRRDNEPVALEAAHIKWHEARGPDLLRNALSLCALHHRLFDKGAFTVSPGRLVIVARNVRGRGFEETLGRFEARPLSAPAERQDAPDPRFTAWHAREVFGSPRHAGAALVGVQAGC